MTMKLLKWSDDNILYLIFMMSQTDPTALAILIRFLHLLSCIALNCLKGATITLIISRLLPTLRNNNCDQLYLWDSKTKRKMKTSVIEMKLS